MTYVSISGLPVDWIPPPGHFSGFWAFGQRASRQICPELQDPAAGGLVAGRPVKINPEMGSGEALESGQDSFFLPNGQYHELAWVELRIRMLASPRFRETSGAAALNESAFWKGWNLNRVVFLLLFLEANGWTRPDHQGELQVERRQPRLLRLRQREPSQRRQLPSNVLLRHPVGRRSLMQWDYDHSFLMELLFHLLDLCFLQSAWLAMLQETDVNLLVTFMIRRSNDCSFLTFLRMSFSPGIFSHFLKTFHSHLCIRVSTSISSSVVFSRSVWTADLLSVSSSASNKHTFLLLFWGFWKWVLSLVIS